jgi:bifunctional DNase/RNase
MTEMEVVGVTPEQQSNRPLVWLKDKEQPPRIFLPIAIGLFEANAICMELYNEPPPRPITYDLLKSILEGLDAKVVKIHINALKEDTFFAEITLEANGTHMEIDSRPSDAIALAIRVGASIYVSEEVLAKAGVVPMEKQIEKERSLEAHLEQPTDSQSVQVETSEEIGHPDTLQHKVALLKARLREAVSREEYEQAALIRDEIGRIEKSEKSADV